MEGSKEAYIDAVVESTWVKVLGLSTQEAHKCRMSGQSFLDIWRNIMSAAALSQEYSQSGFAVFRENVLRNQTMDEQVEMVARLAKRLY